MKILITGATGFIGKSLLKELHRLGHKISVLQRESSVTTSIKDYIVKEWIFNSSTQNFDFVFENNAYDVVIHLATNFLSEHKTEDITSLIDSNLGFGIRLVDSMSRSNTKKLINFNSSWQRFSEIDQSPVNLYAALKDGFNCVLDYYRSAHDLKILNLRIYDSYGPGDERKKLIPLLIKSFKNNIPLEMTPGEQSIDLIHIRDISRAVMKSISLLENDTPEREYAIATKNPVRVKDIVHTLEHLSGKKDLITLGGRNYRPREVMYPDYPVPLLPNWKAEVSLEQGLKELLEEKSAN